MVQVPGLQDRLRWTRQGDLLHRWVNVFLSVGKQITELVFTELILQILYWIDKIAIQSRPFILDLPTNVDL
jgi:hypothetical protein